MSLKIKKLKEHLGDIDYYLNQRKVVDFRAIEKKEKVKVNKKKSLKIHDNTSKKKLDNIESKISRLEKEIANIDKDLLNDYEKTIAKENFFPNYEKKKNELEDLMEKWEKISISLN